MNGLVRRRITMTDTSAARLEKGGLYERKQARKII